MPPRRRLDGPAAQPAKSPALPPAELAALRQRAQVVALRAAWEALLRRRQHTAAATASPVLAAGAAHLSAAEAPAARGHVGQAPMVPDQGCGGDSDGAAQPAARDAVAARPAPHTSPMEVDQGTSAHHAGSNGTCIPTSAAGPLPQAPAQGPAAVATEMGIPAAGGDGAGVAGPSATATGAQLASQHPQHVHPAAPGGRPLNDAALLAARWELCAEPHVA